MDYSKETEADTRANRIDPVLADAGWTSSPHAERLFALAVFKRVVHAAKASHVIMCFYKGEVSSY